MTFAKRVRVAQPLILNLANSVTQQRVADVISYVGGSPLMTTSMDELEELLEISDALVLNIGTINDNLLPLYLEAGRLANQMNKPVILDPVAVMLPYRGRVVKELLAKIKFAVIRGNASEVAWFAQTTLAGKGIDALVAQPDRDIVKLAANNTGAVIVQSGVTDVLSDGHEILTVEAQSDLFKVNVGAGDMLSALIATYSAVTEDYFGAAFAATKLFGESGQLAEILVDHRPGLFIDELLNQLHLSK